MYQVCYTRYHVSFYLWLIWSLLKHCKVPKYYEQDCRSTLLSNVASLVLLLPHLVVEERLFSITCKNKSSQDSKAVWPLEQMALNQKNLYSRKQNWQHEKTITKTLNGFFQSFHVIYSCCCLGTDIEYVIFALGNRWRKILNISCKVPYDGLMSCLSGCND